MKTTKLISALIIIFALAFISTLESCTKKGNSDGGPEAITKAGLLTSETWVHETVVFSFPDGEVMDMMLFMDNCELDNQLIFKSNKVIVNEEGALSCGPSISQIAVSGTWALAENDTKLIITNEGEQTELTDVEISSDHLSFKLSVYDATLGGSIIGRYSYKNLK